MNLRILSGSGRPLLRHMALLVGQIVDVQYRQVLFSAMDPYGKNELISHYNRHLRDFGDHPQAVRWTPRGQTERFRALLDIAGDMNGKKVLDFGCGKGDMLGFMREQGIEVEYTGIDINGSLIGLAEDKYPEAEFLTLDIEKEGVGSDFDIVLICGVFNLRVGGIKESMYGALRRLKSLCRESMHMNMLSDSAARKDPELFYISPEELKEFTRKELSDDLRLREDIVQGDLFLSVFFER